MVVLASILFCVGGVAVADPVSAVWTCELKEGKTSDDAQAVNSKWLAWARKAGGSDEITSSLVSPVVGDVGGFLWVDTFPDLVTWAKVTEATSSEEFKPIGEAFGEVQTCSGNRLWSGEATK